MSNDWPFPDARNFNAFTTARVMERKEPIVSVYHDTEDGAWQLIGDWALDLAVCSPIVPAHPGRGYRG